MKAAVVRPWPRDGIGFLLISTYVVWSYCTISRTDGIGGCSRFAMRPSWDDGGAALVKDPKFLVILEILWVGTQLRTGASSLMVERGVGGVSCCVCACVSSDGLVITPFHYWNREKVINQH